MLYKYSVGKDGVLLSPWSVTPLKDGVLCRMEFYYYKDGVLLNSIETVQQGWGRGGLGMMGRWGYFITKEENIVSWRDTGRFHLRELQVVKCRYDRIRLRRQVIKA